ncbi:DUF2141 domain-containing protein [Flavisphingomonas formosensis]|uniref:DUF2141 domain-containing protein n=1 Tax=Flavisphingomonas formosensis TaxID=861534 RepID=UPI0012FAA92F|nr:DUF2141 domain-containing protein [Sphingomonas formosensis]
MLKLKSAAALAIAVFAAPIASGQAAILGPNVAACQADAKQAAALVVVQGFKNRIGTVRVRAFPANSPDLFRKEGMIDRVVVPTPASGKVAVCVPLPRPGQYAFDVRHDANDNGDTDASDGGGFSGNPKMTLWQAMMKQRPDVKDVAISIGNGVTPVPVILNYKQGLRLGPVNTAER